MPDGSVSLARPLPHDMVKMAEQSFGVLDPHVWVRASVCWLHFVRSGEVVDAVAIAEHYALWCFDKAYYERFLRLVARTDWR